MGVEILTKKRRTCSNGSNFLKKFILIFFISVKYYRTIEKVTNILVLPLKYLLQKHREFWQKMLKMIDYSEYVSLTDRAPSGRGTVGSLLSMSSSDVV